MGNAIMIIILLIVNIAALAVMAVFITQKLSGMDTKIKENKDEIRANSDEIRANSDEIKSASREIKESREALKGNLDEVQNVRTLMAAQKTTNESQDKAIHALNAQMTEINKGIGQVTSVTESVASLNNVLTKVKTRGILGEYQAEGILREVLADNQYEKNFDAAGLGKGTVEFVIKVPGESGDTEYLPIDSKFPLDTFQAFTEAKEGADTKAIEKARNDFTRRLTDEAKDIREKYIAPPRTTPYALMFLPVESMYLEALDSGLFEKLQHDYSVIIVGPTSLSALLSSIEAGYRSIALEAHSEEVWKTLAGVKTEFDKYYDMLEKLQKNLDTASKTLEQILGPRTNKMRKTLSDLTELSDEESAEMFGFDDMSMLEGDTDDEDIRDR